MVVDVLTSGQEQIPPRVTPREEDCRSPPTALRAYCNRDLRPQAVLHAPVFHSADVPESSSASGSLMTARMDPGDGASASKQQRTNSSKRNSTGRCEDRDRSQHGTPEGKTTRSCKRKLDLTSLSLGLHDANKTYESEKKDPESPPPAKRWVIGPLLQSFKSKMASFTEIVMSPVRLFKPSEFPVGSNSEAPSVSPENKEDLGPDGRDDVFTQREEKDTPVRSIPTVKLLKFDTSSSDSLQNPVTVSQNGSEHRQDSIPDDDGSFGALQSARSTDPITGASRVQQCDRKEKQNRDSMNPYPLPSGLVEGSNSGRTSIKEESEKAVKRLIVVCEQKAVEELTTKHGGQPDVSKMQDQHLARNVRLPTPAVRKKKKGRGPEGSEQAEIGTGAGKDGTELAVESPALVQTKTLRNSSKRRKVQIPGDRLSESGAEDILNVASCDPLERENMGLSRASRSRTKRENELRCTLVSLEITSANSDATKSASTDFRANATHETTPAQDPPSTASETWVSTRTTRWRLRKSSDAEGRCGDPLMSSNRTAVRRNNIRQAKHESKTAATPTAKKPQVSKKSWNTRRVKRAVEAFEDQGMSMSLTLKVGSGLDGEKEADSIVTCGLMKRGRKMGEDVMLAEASCPSRTTPDDRGCDVLSETHTGHLEQEDKPRRWCVYVERIETLEEVDREENPKPAPTSSGSGAKRLTRSLSCPDITSLRLANDASVNERTLHHPPCSPLKKVSDLNVNAPSPIKRTRRHTVCSVEIEREIAPLCLRKEVYPKWSSPSVPSKLHVPSRSLASLVSCFLSSPLAFLSKKSARGHGDDGGYGASSGDLIVACSSSTPSPLSLNCLASSGVTSGSAFFTDASCTPEQSSMSSHCSVFEADEGVVRRENEENEQPDAISEEKALSDSEIKVDNKRVEGRKVSSIRIRKTLPKPQYNLTPMGLPKAVRLKKKVFSVEEIYTNKNFSKPPEGRLETIFEVPLSRRDGSQSLIGPKRVKRFVEFPELGVARKPRRPLVGGSGGGGVQRKAAGNSGAGRTRRGREEEALLLQDFDSLLFSKLSELDVWMATEQMVL